MKIQDAAQLIEKKYKVKKYSPNTFLIDFDFMYNENEYVRLYLKLLDNKLIVTDKGAAEMHSQKSGDEIIKICSSNNVKYDDGYLVVDFEKIEDVERLLNTVNNIVNN